MSLRDTLPTAARAQIDAARRLGPDGRLHAAVEMSEDARQISIDGVRRRHPEYSAAEARLVIVRMLYGEELADRFARSRPKE